MLLLKFFVKGKTQTRFVIAKAEINEWGQYQDARYIYTDQGKYEKRFISGLNEQWIDEEGSAEDGQILIQ